MLAGNYNNLARDDFIGRDGHAYFDARDFGETWRIRQRLMCRQPAPARSSTSRDSAGCADKDAKRAARKACDVFSNGVFQRCAQVVNTQPYYE